MKEPTDVARALAAAYGPVPTAAAARPSRTGWTTNTWPTAMANQPREGSVAVCYRLNGALLDRMQQAARELGITYTAFISEAIENKLDQMTVKRSEGTS
jgi:hypothetical protein